MSGYQRVLPRDLFNEADLLKCLGALWIAIDGPAGGSACFLDEDVDRFDIAQNEADGSIEVVNIRFEIRSHRWRLSRPLNARSKWPLWARPDDDEDQDEVRVFDEDGSLSADMLTLIGKTSK